MPTPPSAPAASAERLFAGPGAARALGRAARWAEFPFGPVEGWPAALCTLVPLVLASGLPSALLWGPELALVYNDAYAPLLGPGHPALFGRPACAGAPSAGPHLCDHVARVLAGEAVTVPDEPVTVRPGGDGAPPATRTYTIAYAPVRDAAAPDGPVLGVHLVATETTAQVAGRALAEHLPGAAAFVVDRGLRYVLADGEALHAAGFRPADFVGRTVEEALGPAVGPGSAALYRRALGGEPFELEHAAYGHVYLTRGVPVRDAAGAVGAVLAASYDITARRAAEAALEASEARQAFLLALSDALRDPHDPGEVQAAAARVLGERLGADRAYYGEVDEAHAEYVVERGWHRAGAPGPARRAPLAAWPTPWPADGRPWVVADVDADPFMSDPQRAAYRGSDIGACVVVPLLKGGRLVATLTVHQRAPRAWSRDEVALVQETAERTWAAVGRARAEAALRASEAKYRGLFEHVQGYAIFLLDAEGRVTEWTPGAERVQGYAAAEVLGRSVATFYTPEAVYAGAPARELAEAARAGRAESEGWRVRQNGERFWVNEVLTAVHDGGGRLVGFTAITRDLTERRRADEAAARVRAEEERAVLRRQLAGAEEAERRRLARELHDQLGQHLTGLTLGLADARRRLAADAWAGAAPVEERLARLEALAQAMARDARHLALALRPPELDDVGLESALETYVGQWAARYGVAAEVAITGLHDRAVPGEVGTALYRVAQEALTNVARHAAARHVSVIVEKPDGEVRLIVEDDGRGFDPDVVSGRAPAERRLGLAGMRERVEVVGGSLAVESTPGSGTALYVRIPIAAGDGGPAGAEHPMEDRP